MNGIYNDKCEKVGDTHEHKFSLLRQEIKKRIMIANEDFIKAADQKNQDGIVYHHGIYMSMIALDHWIDTELMVR